MQSIILTTLLITLVSFSNGWIQSISINEGNTLSTSECVSIIIGGEFSHGDKLSFSDNACNSFINTAREGCSSSLEYSTATGWPKTVLLPPSDGFYQLCLTNGNTGTAVYEVEVRDPLLYRRDEIMTTTDGLSSGDIYTTTDIVPVSTSTTTDVVSTSTTGLTTTVDTTTTTGFGSTTDVTTSTTGAISTSTGVESTTGTVSTTTSSTTTSSVSTSTSSSTTGTVSTTESTVSTTGSTVSTTGSTVSTTGSTVSTTGSTVSTTGSTVSTTGSTVSTTGSTVSTTGSTTGSVPTEIIIINTTVSQNVTLPGLPAAVLINIPGIANATAYVSVAAADIPDYTDPAVSLPEGATFLYGTSFFITIKKDGWNLESFAENPIWVTVDTNGGITAEDDLWLYDTIQSKWILATSTCPTGVVSIRYATSIRVPICHLTQFALFRTPAMGSPAPVPGPAKSSDGGLSDGAIAAAVVVPIIVVLAAIVVALFLIKRRQRSQNDDIELANPYKNRKPTNADQVTVNQLTSVPKTVVVVNKDENESSASESESESSSQGSSDSSSESESESELSSSSSEEERPAPPQEIPKAVSNPTVQDLTTKGPGAKPITQATLTGAIKEESSESESESELEQVRPNAAHEESSEEESNESSSESDDSTSESSSSDSN